MKKNNYYYNIDEDIARYPDCWAYIIVGGRNTGKTYGALKSCIGTRKHCFIKRTQEDVHMLCSGSGRIGAKVNQYGIDLSPYKSLNRDLNTNIKAFEIEKGLGGFWNCDFENNCIGEPIGYLLSLTAVSKFKGFDLSDCDWMIFDEFIPQPWERLNHKEGEQIMDLYKTISRDREHRQKEPLKLIALANAVSASSPLTDILEITDCIVDMQLQNIETLYIEERGIFIRVLQMSDEFMDVERSSKIYKAMANTDWGQMAFENQFGYDDFTNVGKINLKGFMPIVSFRYKTKEYYIYNKEGLYYMTNSRSNNSPAHYNLNTENGQKKFHIDYGIDLRLACIDGNMIFQTYTMYRLIVNYTKIFKL